MMRKKPVRFFLLVFGIPALIGCLLLTFLADWNWLGSWLIAANLSALLVWAFDKFQSKRQGWRVPELALHVIAALGATPAAFLGMKLFRHKTMKLHFRILYGLLFLIQLALFLTLATGETQT